jgi:hypothetical protein
MALSTAAGLSLVEQYGAAEKWLAVLVTQRPGRESNVSVVNAGVLAHPRTGERSVAFVARGATAKLRNLRAHPRATLVFRSGWEWVGVSGSVELAGPDDELSGVTPAGLRQLLRDVYTAAGGVHHDLGEYDRVMAAERRTAVLLRPTRFIANPPGTDHEEHP